MPAAVATLVSLALLAAPPQEPDATLPAPRIHVDEPASVSRDGLVTVSVPWPRGAHREVDAVVVGERTGRATTVLRWPDGSVRLSRVHVVLPVPAGGADFALGPVTVDAARDAPAVPVPTAWDVLPLRFEVADPWGRVFVADLTAARWNVHADLSTGLLSVRSATVPAVRVDDAGRTTAFHP